MEVLNNQINRRRIKNQISLCIKILKFDIEARVREKPRMY